MSEPITVPSQLNFRGGLQLEVPPGGGTSPLARAFSMEAYTGSRVSLGFIDLTLNMAGYVPPTKPQPILRQHDPKCIIGLAPPGAAVHDGKLSVRGQLYNTPAAAEVASLADQGFPWEASVGAQFLELEYVDEDEECEVNGRKEKGPMLHGKRWTTNELSFVPLGADRQTSAVVLSANSPTMTVNRKDPMADQTTAPQAPPQPKPEQPKAASVAELKANFSDASFVLECVEAGLTLEQAKLKHYEILKSKPQTPVSQLAGAGTTTQVAVNLADQWEELVQLCLKETGNNRPLAVKLAAHRNPKLREAYVEQYNQNHTPRAR